MYMTSAKVCNCTYVEIILTYYSDIMKMLTIFTTVHNQ